MRARRIAKPRLGCCPPSRRPSSPCQTARSRPPPRSTSRSRGAFFAPGSSRRFSLSPPHLRCLGRRFGGARAQILGVSCSSDPEMRGRRSAGRRTTLVRRASKTRPHACEACPSRATGTSASRRSTVALPRPRCVSGISAGAGQGWLAGHRSWPATDPGFDRGYEPRPTPHPAPPSGSSPETPLMSEDDKSCTIYSLRSQYINSNRSRPADDNRWAPKPHGTG